MVDYGSTSILLIENNPIEAMNIRYVFESCGINGPLTHLVNAEEALLYLRKHSRNKPSLILLDMDLPTMSACQFMQSLKNEEIFNDIAVIVYGGDGAKESLSYHMEASGFIAKSEDCEHISYQLAEVVNDLVMSNVVAA
jgi:CheY-like chemotaxis protein